MNAMPKAVEFIAVEQALELVTNVRRKFNTNDVVVIAFFDPDGNGAFYARKRELGFEIIRRMFPEAASTFAALNRPVAADEFMLVIYYLDAIEVLTIAAPVEGTIN